MKDNQAFHARQKWWWRFTLPAGVIVFVSLWSIAALWRIQEARGERLYALFAHSDSAGTGEIFWEQSGERQAFQFVTLPYCVGLGLLAAAIAFGSSGTRPRAGWPALLTFWGYGLFCTLVLSVVFAWLWINVVGVFI